MLAISVFSFLPLCLNCSRRLPVWDGHLDSVMMSASPPGDAVHWGAPSFPVHLPAEACRSSLSISTASLSKRLSVLHMTAVLSYWFVLPTTGLQPNPICLPVSIQANERRKMCLVVVASSVVASTQPTRKQQTVTSVNCKTKRLSLERSRWTKLNLKTIPDDVHLFSHCSRSLS